MFAIPWLGHTLVGTTDTPIEAVSPEPRAQDAEIDVILETVSRYLTMAPTRADIRSVFTGIRPLIKKGAGASTAALSREHSIHVSRSGLVSIGGGKWTTYRVMAKDCVDEAAKAGELTTRECVTKDLRLHGWTGPSKQTNTAAAYGSYATAVEAIVQETPGWDLPANPAAPHPGEVIWAARQEMARTVEDVLARRSRLLFLDARAAVTMAPAVAAVLAKELGRDEGWVRTQLRDFEAVADGYTPRR
jgi:glycerol-3-phosphate dehydrogenase